MQSTLVRQETKAYLLSNYVLSLKPENLPKDVIHEVKRRVLDSLACAVGAYNSKVSKYLLKTCPKVKGKYSAQLFGKKKKAFYEEAAFLNGSLVRYLDFNDTYLSLEPAHPSDNIAPLIAVAQAYGKSGLELILAIAVAYEIQCRLCDGASLRSKGIDHVTYGAFSIACGAAILMELNEEELKNAIGIAGVCNIATRQTRVGEMSMWKACAFANAARQGLFACRLAKEGITGPQPIFEGTRGFETLISGPINLILPKLGEMPRKILETYIKPYPVEYHAQSAVAAAIQLHRDNVKMDQIMDMTIYTHGASYQIIGSEPEKWRPTSKETADHSLPYCTAIALKDGDVSDDSFQRKNYRDSYMLKFMKKIKVVEDPRYTENYPQSFGNRLEVNLLDGRKIVKEILHPFGHPQNPMSDEDIFNKWKMLAKNLLSEQKVQEQINETMNLDKRKDMSDFLPVIA
ncbi:MAG: MmgE/PrpD family protein [Candidatus Melainabacteria bacterium]|nr:MmgE/PrpD family protein [Candidatus Melainabacteria bacterium]